ncbi:hypothetical protein OB981_12600 [Bacillus cereus]|nr:hypothetical protein [Bacillus cereus]
MVSKLYPITAPAGLLFTKKSLPTRSVLFNFKFIDIEVPGGELPVK